MTIKKSPSILFGLNSLASVSPSPVPADPVEDTVPYSHNQLVPFFHDILKKGLPAVWEEVFLLCYKYQISLPHLVVPTIQQSLKEEKIHFFDLSKMLPRQEGAAPEWMIFIDLPHEGFSEFSAHHQLRFLKKRWVEDQEISTEHWKAFWKKAKQPLQIKAIDWLQKLPSEVALPLIEALPPKKGRLQIKMTAVDFRHKGARYSDFLQKELQSDQTQLPKAEWSKMIHPEALIPSQNRRLPAAALCGSFFHEDLACAQRISQKNTSIFLEKMDAMPYLTPENSERVLSFLMGHNLHPSWILSTLQSNDHFWSAKAAQRWVRWLESYNLQSDTLDAIIAIWDHLSIKGDPSLLSGIILFKEKHPYLEGKYLRKLNKAIQRLQWRVGFRKAVHKAH